MVDIINEDCLVLTCKLVVSSQGNDEGVIATGWKNEVKGELEL